MTSSHLEYAINSLAFFLGGCLAASIYWRIYGRRVARRAGAPKEPPLSVFTAVMVGLVSVVSALFAWSSNIESTRTTNDLRGVVACQERVNGQFRDGYADRVNINTQDRNALDALIAALKRDLADPASIRSDINAYQAVRMQNDLTRAANPVTVSGQCTKPKGA